MQKSSARDPEKILVRATNWVGDGVMSLPALEALRERFPSAEIVLVVKPLAALGIVVVLLGYSAIRSLRRAAPPPNPPE